jgi:hypothetical protein
MAIDYPSTSDTLSQAQVAGNTTPRAIQNSYVNGTMTLAGVTPGGLQSAIEATLVSGAGQTAGNYNFTVITKLALANLSSLNETDLSFMITNLTRLTSLDLSGYANRFTVDFQNIKTLTEVALPAGAGLLAPSMFNGNENLTTVVFTGETAPIINPGAFTGVKAIAYVPNPNTGGYESQAFKAFFTEVRAIAVPAFTTNPQNQTVTVGQNASFTVAATGAPAPTLQWQISTNNGQTWTNIAGQTGTTLTLNSVAHTQNASLYRAVATSLAGEVISGAASLTVNAVPTTNAQNPNITNQPGNATVTLDRNVTLSVTATVTDGGTLSYQWFSNNTNSNTGGTLINRATNPTFAPPTDTTGVTYYYVVVTNTNDAVNGTKTATTVSNAVSVTVNSVPGAPQDLNVIFNDDQTTLTWEAPESNGNSEITKYEVLGGDITAWIDANGEYEHTFYNLVPGKDYTFTVRAINAIGIGETARIRVTTPEEEIIHVSSVYLDTEELTLNVGEYASLMATVVPQNANDTTVVWTSSDESVATIDQNGVVTALTPNDGGYTASSTVTVAGAVDDTSDASNSSSDHTFLWISLGALAPLGTGTGIYFWRKNKKAK